MDLQKFIDDRNEAEARDRGKSHLTCGELMRALLAAPADAEFDPRVKGIGSWRGSYIEIALFTVDSGYSAYDGEFHGDWKDYTEWAKTHQISGELPRNANELGKLLQSLIGKDFVGYKGGNYTIEEYKPLWLEADSGSCASVAVTGIDTDLKLITKELDED